MSSQKRSGVTQSTSSTIDPIVYLAVYKRCWACTTGVVQARVDGFNSGCIVWFLWI